MASSTSRFRTVGEAGRPAPAARNPLRPGPAANDNRAPFLRRLLPPLIGLGWLACAAAALYGYLA